MTTKDRLLFAAIFALPLLLGIIGWLHDAGILR